MNRFFLIIVASGILYNIILNYRSPDAKPDPYSVVATNNLQKLKDNFIKKKKVEREIKARLTVYWAKGSGTDRDTARKRSSSGATLKEGVSVAVDPRLIPFYKRLYIPNLGFRVAHDTGTAVKLKKASGGKLPVIDVFFEKKQDALDFAYNHPKIVTVSIYKY